MFEVLRRDRETRNEIIISYIVAGALLSAVSLNLATHWFAIAPYVGANSRLVVGGVALGLRLLFVWYLQRWSVYSRYRKYLVSTFDLLVFTLLIWDFGQQLIMLHHFNPERWTFVTSFALCAYTILVILNGLRYSTKVVAYNVLVASGLHAVMFVRHVEPEYQLIMAMLSVGVLMPIAFSVGYSVKSLLQMHEESALKEYLARFLPPELVQQMAGHPELLQRQTERREATVVFVDICGFTQLSERLVAEDVVEFLNAFLEEMTAAILQYQGMVDKYIGDSVMGVFGVPIQREDHALRAYQAGLEMCERLVHLNLALEKRGLPKLAIGIGIHTGELLIGTIGSRTRLDYTVVGDTVNTASRLESLTRCYGVQMILSGETRAQLPEDLPLYPVDLVQVKHRMQAVQLWSPTPLLSNPSSVIPGAMASVTAASCVGTGVATAIALPAAK
jgi:class 3 adenylate cyclase